MSPRRFFHIVAFSVFVIVHISRGLSDACVSHADGGPQPRLAAILISITPAGWHPSGHAPHLRGESLCLIR
jgi:hypothetical protein